MTSTLKHPETALEDHLPWSEQLRSAYTSLAALRHDGFRLDASSAAEVQAERQQLKFRVPRAYAALFDRSDLARCPLFRQAVPSALELDPILPPWATSLSRRATGADVPWSQDAIGDLAHLAAPRLTHRYHRRAILHTTLACALYCRFCFRKSHMAEQEGDLYGGSFTPAFDYLAAHPEVEELILTGGDPLSLSDASLGRLTERARRLGSIKTLRLHTRLPGVLPARLTRELAQTLRNAAGEMHVALVAHINHPKELTPRMREGFGHLRREGISLLHQAVLLRSINDDAAVLEQLLQTLWHWGCLPFYLHHPDWTPSTFGFRCSIAEGRRLMSALGGRLSGPALPKYVLDVPGGAGKISLTDARCEPLSGARDCGRDEAMSGQLWRIPHAVTRAPSRTAFGLYLDLAPAG